MQINKFHCLQIIQKKYLIFPICLFLPILLNACASKNLYLKAHIITANFLNPNLYYQAAPVVITLYQLKSAFIFEQSNFFSLYNNASATLGNEMLDKTEIEMSPNQKQTIVISLSPFTHFIGVVAEFRNPDKTQWRQIKAVKLRKNTAITVQVSSNAIWLQ